MEMTTTETPAFCIDTAERADWLLRKLGNLAAEKSRITAQAAAIVAQLDTDTARLMHLYGAQLEAFAREELARRGNRRRSLTLLQGTCAFRSVPGGFRLADPAAALEHVQNEPSGYAGLIDLVPRLRTDDYRAIAQRHYEETGELLPGTEDRADRETLTVKFGKSE